MSQEKIDENDLKFVTKGTISRDIYKIINDLALRKNVLIKILLLVYLVLVICLIWSALHRVWLYIVCCVGGILVFSLVIIINRNRAINISIQRIREIYGTDSIECMTGFNDEIIYYENKCNDTCIAVTYKDIKYMYDTKKFLFLMTKGSQFITVFKDCLSTEEQKSLFNFLKQKGIREKR